MPDKKVLIIDPHVDFSRAARGYLLNKDEVCAVKTVTTAGEALRAAGSFKPDLLFVDNLFLRRGAGGSGFLSLLKKKMPQVKMILMTLYPQHDGFYEQPGYELLNGRISKLEFAKELKLMLKDSLAGCGRID